MDRRDAWQKECLKRISAMQKQLDELRVMIKTKEKEEPSKGDVVAEKVKDSFVHSLYEKEEAPIPTYFELPKVAIRPGPPREFKEGFVRTPQGRESFLQKLREEMEKYDNRWRPSQQGDTIPIGLFGEKIDIQRVNTEIEKERERDKLPPLQPIPQEKTGLEYLNAEIDAEIMKAGGSISPIPEETKKQTLFFLD